MNNEKKLPIWSQLVLGSILTGVLISANKFNLLIELASGSIVLIVLYLYRESIKKICKSLTAKKVLRCIVLGISLGIAFIFGFIWYMIVAIIFCITLYYFFY